MTTSPALVVCGASARAAAFSALRAGMQPVCVDLFADADLQARAEVVRVPRSEYPTGLPRRLRQLPPELPWMYTGGLENHPDVVDAISRERPLWGNPAAVLRRVRVPGALTDAGVSAPSCRLTPEDVPADGTWLCKPVAGSGGAGIVPWLGVPPPRRHCYWQQRVSGQPAAALFLAEADHACSCLGVTRQLVGEPWLHAPAFAYCGSIGPLPLPATVVDALDRCGRRVVQTFGLRGLFGLDLLLDDDRFWAVEINPRYTASVEVLEHTLGLQALHGHRAAFVGGGESLSSPAGPALLSCAGKAILFAREHFVFPADGPWRETLDALFSPWHLPAWADLPVAGSVIEKGQPVLTLLETAATVDECLHQLKKRAALLDRLFFGR